MTKILIKIFFCNKLCKKKELGLQELMITDDYFIKDISLLARNGFDFETSKKVMDIERMTI